MKKFLVFVLTLVMVVSMAAAALAVEVSYEGLMELKWQNDPNWEDDAVKDGETGFDSGDLEAKIFWDFTEDFGDGVSAGLKLKTELTKDDKNLTGDVIEVEDVNFWAKFDYDTFAVTASTYVKGGVGNDFGEFDLTEAGGVEVVANLIDNFTATGMVTNGWGDYRFLAKGEYAADGLTLGGGFQSEAGVDEDEKKTALGVYGSYQVMDALTVKGEFGSRKFGVKDEDAITGILAGAKYDDGVIMADANYLKLDCGFDIIDFDDDGDDWRLVDYVKEGVVTASVIFVDASYALSDALKVVGYLDYLLSAEDAAENDIYDDLENAEKMAYKVGLENQFTDKLKGEAWFRGFDVTNNADEDPVTQIGAKATYAFVDDVVGSFEVTNGQQWDDEESYFRYTAKLAVTL